MPQQPRATELTLIDEDSICLATQILALVRLIGDEDADPTIAQAYYRTTSALLGDLAHGIAGWLWMRLIFMSVYIQNCWIHALQDARGGSGWCRSCRDGKHLSKFAIHAVLDLSVCLLLSPKADKPTSSCQDLSTQTSTRLQTQPQPSSGWKCLRHSEGQVEAEGSQTACPFATSKLSPELRSTSLPADALHAEFKRETGYRYRALRGHRR